MLFGMSTIILKWSHSPYVIIFRYSSFKIGQSGRIGTQLLVLYLLLSPASRLMASRLLEFWLTYDRMMLPIVGLFYEFFDI